MAAATFSSNYRGMPSRSSKPTRTGTPHDFTTIARRVVEQAIGDAAVALYVHVLQLRPGPPNAARDASDGRRGGEPCLDHRGDYRARHLAREVVLDAPAHGFACEQKANLVD